VKILIIEDEVELAISMVDYLRSEAYSCEVASNYNRAMDKIQSFEYDCVLLDIMLPGGDGLNLLESMRTLNKQQGVIIISAKGSIEDKVKGLHIGADDYLAKPFHLSELSARIHSVIRRRQFGHSNVIAAGDLEIDLLSKTVQKDQTPIVLTKREFDLLLFLISNKNRVVSKAALAEHLSGEMADMLDNYDSVYAHVKNLKRKLAEVGCHQYIQTKYGVGYKWQA
jgi:DNA-binding response OmpR family regulator